ncbi:mRNA turnover and ribosome assembly protein [Tilletia horrida]|uniref:Ribosome assembly factor mrt4 n=1 Tax=Tilletia horrida TaxID=155126 RepID=A0AAN6GQB1_9BASI|nr:mRNA turnover and ribosome assembly protein [Tilletia horrida]
MPRTKRNKVISLTKTTRKTREHKTGLLDKVRAAAEEFPYIWIIQIQSDRATFLHEVRELWKGSKIFYGKIKVLSFALGTSPETELRPGLSQLAKRLSGRVGILLTATPPQEVLDWFATHSRKDYARGGTKATEDIVLPEGPVMIRTDPPETLPHNMETQLRALGMPTELKRGVPTLLREYTVCKKGQTLTAESAQILKHLVIQMSEFRITPLAYWSAEKSSVVETNGGIKARKEKSKGEGRKSSGAKDVDMDDNDKEDVDDDEDVEIDDDDEDDDEEDGVAAGDKVTSSMMLPAGI